MEVEKTAPPQRGITEEEAGKRIAALLNPTKGKSEPPVAKEPEAPATAEATTEVVEESEPPEGDPPAQEEKRKYKVPVDGEEIEVDEDELLRGYSRTANYTRKSQKLSEERKAFEAEAKAVREERQRYAETLSKLEAQLSEPDNVDASRLLAEDPIEFVRWQALQNAKKERLAAIESEKRRLAEVAEADRQKSFQAWVQEEQQKLLYAIPDLKDGRKANAARERISEYGRTIGLSDTDLNSLYDHRLVVALHEASLYRKMKADAQKATEKAKDSPKTAAPGNLQSRVVDQDLAAARERFGQKRDVHTLGAYIQKRLTQPQR